MTDQRGDPASRRWSATILILVILGIYIPGSPLSLTVMRVPLTRGNGRTERSRPLAHHLSDVLGEALVDFSMPGNRLGQFGGRIVIPIVIAAVSEKDTSHYPAPL
jgi:hypothetical protein